MQFVRSNTFQWTAGLAVLFAIFVTILFGFIYFKIDDYLIVRSDRMITRQANFFAKLSRDRLITALDDHLGQDSRGVQFSGVFDVKGNRLIGNVVALPAGLDIGAPPRNVPLANVDNKDTVVCRAVVRRLDNDDILVVGRNVDETAEISRVVGGALAVGLLPAFCLWLLA